MKMMLRCIIRAAPVAILTLVGTGCRGASESATGPETPIPSFAEAACKRWSCQTATCGYDPASDPRGACCTLRGTPAVPKPSCEYTPPCSPGVNC